MNVFTAHNKTVLNKRNGHAACKHRILPHVTPSPRVPAAEAHSVPVSLLSFLPNLGQPDLWSASFSLPHVTPSPRVPAADGLCGSGFPKGLIVSFFPLVSGEPAGSKASSASRHSFPKSTCICRQAPQVRSIS
jgi:hypothetical protein